MQVDHTYTLISKALKKGFCRNDSCGKRISPRKYSKGYNSNYFFQAWMFCSEECLKDFRNKRVDGAKERVAAFLKRKEDEKEV